MELCLLRLANPNESLEDLAKICSFKISKSGINHRFRKIIQIADELTKKDLTFTNKF